MNTCINLQKISLWRDEKLVLDDITWTTRKDEHWFLLGNNGSGKTSLLEIIMGYLWPQKGSVCVLGEKFGETYIPELRTRIGYISSWILTRIPQYAKTQNVIASGTNASVDFYNEIPDSLIKKILRQMDYLKIAALYDQPFGKLSTGQQLLVLLARALIIDPRILILDEPFALLDISNRHHMFDQLNKINAEDNSPQFLLVTHHLEEIIPIFSHGLILKERKIFSIGPKKIVLDPDNIKSAFNL